MLDCVVAIGCSPLTSEEREEQQDSKDGAQTTVTSPPLGGVSECSSWQVFGLAGCLLAPASRPMAEPVLVGVFVPAYRCGAVPASHRIPFSADLSRSGHREVKPTLSGALFQVKHYI
jgi:hypothetical protein